MKNNSPHIVFIVQAEGRGHLTQALAAKNILEKAGYHIPAVLLGQNPFRTVPDYFIQKCKCPVIRYRSPNIIRKQDDKAISLFKSFFYNFFRIPGYFREFSRIKHELTQQRADLILNFHEPMTGPMLFFTRIKTPVISVAHQYLYHHPDFKLPPIPGIQKLALKTINRLSTFKSQRILALGFRKYNDQVKKKLYVTPPILRSEILGLNTEKRDFWLVYLLNPGYAEEIMQWHQNNPMQEIHVFWEKNDRFVNEQLHFHKLDDEKFLQMLAQCSALITNAGFESVCEAKYLGKPVMMVPVEKHYEQQINAYDARLAGAGTVSRDFELDKVEKLINNYKTDKDFKVWVESCPEKLLEHIESVIKRQ